MLSLFLARIRKMFERADKLEDKWGFDDRQRPATSGEFEFLFLRWHPQGQQEIITKVMSYSYRKRTESSAYSG